MTPTNREEAPERPRDRTTADPHGKHARKPGTRASGTKRQRFENEEQFASPVTSAIQVQVTNHRGTSQIIDELSWPGRPQRLLLDSACRYGGCMRKIVHPAVRKPATGELDQSRNQKRSRAPAQDL